MEQKFVNIGVGVYRLKLAFTVAVTALVVASFMYGHALYNDKVRLQKEVNLCEAGQAAALNEMVDAQAEAELQKSNSL